MMPIQAHSMGQWDDSNKQLWLKTAPSGPDFLWSALYSETPPAQLPCLLLPPPPCPS